MKAQTPDNVDRDCAYASLRDKDKNAITACNQLKPEECKDGLLFETIEKMKEDVEVSEDPKVLANFHNEVILNLFNEK